MSDLKGHIATLIGTNAQMDGIAALMAAEQESMCKQRDERDTEFVKRIARAYNQHALRGMLANFNSKD